jgi:transcriptional regulator with XRE-family HTH domain
MRLVIARVYRGHYNVASAALAVGESRQTWANWERGKPMRHRDAVIAKIARALDVDEDWLRDGGPLGPTGHTDPDGPEGQDGAGWLPRLDSNQQPSG